MQKKGLEMIQRKRFYPQSEKYRLNIERVQRQADIYTMKQKQKLVVKLLNNIKENTQNSCDISDNLKNTVLDAINDIENKFSSKDSKLLSSLIKAENNEIYYCYLYSCQLLQTYLIIPHYMQIHLYFEIP